MQFIFQNKGGFHMALRKKIIKIYHGVNVEFDSAYIRVDRIINGTKDRLFIDVGIYNSDITDKIESQTHNFIPSVQDGSDNYHKQGYDYLKTLPEYSDAIDC